MDQTFRKYYIPGDMNSSKYAARRRRNGQL